MTTHFVLVPGFGGFDALGQMRYYAGVTSMFTEWRGYPARAAMLHYYDNVPTASVATRAKGLRIFLAKLVIRGVINEGDSIALIGHSTGGLDIRQAVRDLYEEPSIKQLDSQQVHTPTNEVIRKMIKHLVFLSVPQLGTNIADWVKKHDTRNFSLLAGLLRGGFGAGGLLAKLDVRHHILNRIDTSASDLAKAVADAQRDADGVESENGWVAAEARQAKADIELWLGDVQHDFLAIEDLASARTGDPTCRRLVDEAARGGELERSLWQRVGIKTRSYATIGRWPFEGNGPPSRDGDELASLLAIVDAAGDDSLGVGIDPIYRVAYTACATGPFSAGDRVAARWFVEPKAGPLGASHTPESWENDGVVNTASMLWPDGAETLLVSGDHADIIGHYELQEVAPADRTADGRKHDAYDLLGSRCEFDGAAFKKVWFDVFDFVKR